MTFSEFLENSNPDHIFSLLCIGGIMICCWLLLFVFVTHFISRFVLLLSNKDSWKRNALKHIEIAGFWDGRKIERSCNIKQKDCLNCPLRSCHGRIKAQIKATEYLQSVDDLQKGDDC